MPGVTGSTKPDDLRSEGYSLFDEGPPPAVPERFNLAAYCLAASETTPEKSALLVYRADPAGGAPVEAERWRYEELRRAVGRVAGGLREAGLARGDRVLLRLSPTARFPLLYFGTMAAGGVAMPLSLGLSPAETVKIARDAGPRFACLEATDPARDALTAEGVPLLSEADIAAIQSGPEAPFADTGADDPALLIYTSGSSGRPKGVLHAHRMAYARRMMWRDWYDLRPDDRLLHAGALNWSYTLGAGLMDPWAAGATSVVWLGDADPDVWPRLAAIAQPTLFAATPAHYRRILKYGADLADSFRSVRHGFSAGEALAPDLRRGWERAAGFALHEALGMSECSTYLSSAPHRPSPEGVAGRPQRGRRIAILPPPDAIEAGEQGDDGEDGTTPLPLGAPGMIAIHARDPGLMLGYFNDPASTAAARRGPWFLTGDVGSMDAEGWVRYLGRADDQMNAMGFRVAPQEVEAALCDTPGLAEGAAAETRLGGGVSLIVFYATPAADADPDALRRAILARAAETLADYKRPREVVVLDALPRSSAGKILRRRLGEIGAETLTKP